MESEGGMGDEIVTERLRRKIEEVNAAAQSQLAGIQDHVNFTLQKAYFKCAYECFDRRRRQQDISNCVEHCTVPVMHANGLVQQEMDKFQERLERSLLVCQDRFEASRLKQLKTDAINDLESCVDEVINDNIQVLPHIVDRLKVSLAIGENNDA